MEELRARVSAPCRELPRYERGISVVNRGEANPNVNTWLSNGSVGDPFSTSSAFILVKSWQGFATAKEA
jgi:hypothetical protein